MIRLMEDSFLLLLLIQIVLIALNAVFACAEIAVLSINELKLQRMADDGSKSAKRLVKLTGQPAKFLATIQVAITLSGFLGSAFAADNFSEPLVEWLTGIGVPISRNTLDSIAVIFITLVLSFFTLVFGELVPKRIAMKRSEQIALKISGLISAISLIFKPIVSLLSISTNAVLRLCGIDPDEAEDNVSEEEIRTLVDAGGEKGTIDVHEKEFIHNVFEFNDTEAGEILTHRTEVAILFTDSDDSEWSDIIHSSRHTRYPVCDGSPDNVVGVLNAKDYFRLEDKSRASVMKNAVSPAYFVTETIKADMLFRNMKKDGQVFAVVIDEYGGMAGIISIYDLIEELVGEITDEDDSSNEPAPHIENLTENSWHITGNVTLEELTESVEIEFDYGDHSTLTGMVFDRLGYVPSDGDSSIDLTIAGMKIHITKIASHQIEEAVISVDSPASEADNVQ